MVEFVIMAADDKVSNVTVKRVYISRLISFRVKTNNKFNSSSTACKLARAHVAGVWVGQVKMVYHRMR